MKSAEGIQSKLSVAALTGLATLLVVTPLLYNGTPLYYPDSLGYIFWGQQWQPVPERVSTYAAFVRAAALGRDLWFPVLLQGLLTALVLKRLWNLITDSSNSVIFLLALFLLGILSPLGWTTSTLMPDIFCALSGIFLWFILYPTDPNKINWYDLAGFVFCTSQHLSAVLINGMLLVIFGIWFFFRHELKNSAKRLAAIFSGLVMTCLVIGLVHWSMSKSFFISRSGPAFITARLVETGVAGRYLNQHSGNFPEFQSEIENFPMPAEHFLWQPKSPIHRLGGINDREGIMASLNRKVLSDPSSLFLFLKSGLKSGMKQFFLLDLGDGLGAGAFPQLCFYPENQAESITSKQSIGIDFEKLNTWCQLFLVLVSAIFLLAYQQEHLTISAKNLGIFILILLLVNAFVNGALSTPLNRYQVRVSWLVYFWLLAAAFKAYKNKVSPVYQSPIP